MQGISPFKGYAPSRDVPCQGICLSKNGNIATDLMDSNIPSIRLGSTQIDHLHSIRFDQTRLDSIRPDQPHSSRLDSTQIASADSIRLNTNRFPPIKLRLRNLCDCWRKPQQQVSLLSARLSLAEAVNHSQGDFRAIQSLYQKPLSTFGGDETRAATSAVGFHRNCTPASAASIRSHSSDVDEHFLFRHPCQPLQAGQILQGITLSRMGTCIMKGLALSRDVPFDK